MSPEETPKFDLQEHLKKEHHMGGISEYLKEIIYGGNNGIVTTFAVVAGFNGASMGGESTLGLGVTAVLLFGVANLLADGASMGLGNYLSIRSAQDLYRANRKREALEISYHPAMEAEESVEILKQKGISEEDAHAFVELYKKNPGFWADFMMDYELCLPNAEHDRPIFSGLATFFSFSLFGFIVPVR